MISRLLISLPISLLCAHGSDAEHFEDAPNFLIQDIVEPSLIEGPYHKLNHEVSVENFGYSFELESSYGDYSVWGAELLTIRIHELEAIAALKEIGQTEAFAKSLSQSLKNPLLNTWNVTRQPIKSVVGIPGGVSRYLQGKFYQVRKGSAEIVSKAKKLGKTKDAKESSEKTAVVKKVKKSANKASKEHLGFNAAKRAWAHRLKVDPYSRNAILQAELERIAWVSSAGAFAGDMAIPGHEVLSYVGKVQDLVWKSPAIELERRNFVALKRIGVDKKLIRAFNDHEVYSLSAKTALALALKGLKGVDGREMMLPLIMAASDYQEAFLIVKTFGALENYHRLVAPIDRLAIRMGMVVAYCEDGKMILPLCIDYMHWTPVIYDVVQAHEMHSAQREIWITGVASPYAENRVSELGWAMQQKSLERFKKIEREQVK